MKTKGIMAVLAAGLATALFATSPSVTWYVDSSAPAGGGGFLVDCSGTNKLINVDGVSLTLTMQAGIGLLV
jgi:hypothetical protein